jgi:hypothetical protein
MADAEAGVPGLNIIASQTQYPKQRKYQNIRGVAERMSGELYQMTAKHWNIQFTKI